nr:MAG TPA: hypothetical protein [Caudoviricetes sp.]
MTRMTLAIVTGFGAMSFHPLSPGAPRLTVS